MTDRDIDQAEIFMSVAMLMMCAFFFAIYAMVTVSGLKFLAAMSMFVALPVGVHAPKFLPKYLLFVVALTVSSFVFDGRTDEDITADIRDTRCSGWGQIVNGRPENCDD